MSAGRVLARLTVAPALLTVAWLAVSLPLLMAGLFRLGPSLALFVPASFIALKLGFRDKTRRELTAGLHGPVSWWVTGGVLAIAVAFLALQIAMCSEQVIVRRDPASYVQFATWLNDHGSLPVSEMRWAFGGGDPALEYGSPAFYQVGGAVVPQFMAGLPLVLALGGWIGGTDTLLAMGPLLGACAVLSFGGLTARLVGPRWAPAGALALALTMPMQWVSRSTFSELPALVLLLGGLSLLHDVRELESGAARVRAFLAGLALGLIVLVRIDGVRDLLPIVVFAGLLVARGRRTGLPLGAGLTIGAGAGLVEGLVLSRPYLDYLRPSLEPALMLTVMVIAATGLLVGALKWRVTGRRLRRIGVAVAAGRLPDLAAVLTVLVVVGFAVRPHLQTVRRAPADADDRINAAFIEEIQKLTHQAVDGTRQYSELSLYWVVWYIGVPALLLAAFGAALLARRLLRRSSAEWLLPYATIVWTTVTTLWRPGITPDQPWASRRLVSIVIPGLLLLAIWGLAWAVRRVRRLGYGPRPTGLAALAGAALIMVPIVATSGALMFTRTDHGEVAAVRGLCRKLGPGRSVVIVEPITADRFSQVIRGMCGVPTARTVRTAREADVRRVIGRIRQAGRRPVVLGANPSDVAAYGPAEQALRLRARQDERSLVSPPNGTWPLVVDVWMSQPQS